MTETREKAHITLKAVTTVTDEGVFEAVISTQGIDRERDVVDADGMVKALRKWPRQIPTTWEHSTKPEDIFGHIDPQSVKNVNGEVVAMGQVDLDSKNGADAWRSFKARRVGFSFAYLTLAGTPRKGGGTHITELDVFEITATRTPMNNDTRVLSTKTVDDAPADDGPDVTAELQEVKARLDTLEKALEDQKTKTVEGTDKEPPARSVDPLRQQAEKAALEVASGGTDRLPQRQAKALEPTPDLMDLGELKQRSRDLMLQVLTGTE